MSSLVPIQELRYNLDPRLDVGDFTTPIYKYQGYIQNRIMPRGADERNIMLENRRAVQKDAENVRLIMDRPMN
tara:strand:+ start:6636 stop:6854 length:219 start_codon:yes stop_codon:yes gene_type:complete